MKMFKKAAAFILAAVISATALQATAFADDTAAGTEYVELALMAAKKPAKTTLKVTATRSGYKFSWKKVSGVKAYEIYALKDGQSKYDLIATVAAGKTSKTVTNLDNSKSYKFKIRSYKLSSGKKVYSSFSSTVSIKAVDDAATVNFGNKDDKNTTPARSNKQLNLLTVPTSKIDRNLGDVVQYLGQDLYVIKEKNSEKKYIYQITKSALRSYKTTGKLKATKIKIDESIDNYIWDVAASQLGKCNKLLLSFKDGSGTENYATVEFDSGNKAMKTLCQSPHFTVLTSEGYTLQCYWSYRENGADTVKIAVIEAYADDGRLNKRYTYDEPNLKSNFLALPDDEGVWYITTANGSSRTRLIDRKGNEETFIPSSYKAYFGCDDYLIYFPITSEYMFDPPVSEYKLLVRKNGKTYNFKDLDASGIDVSGTVYYLDDFQSIKGTKAIAVYNNDDNRKYAEIDLATGKLLTPVYDYMRYDKKTGMYIAYTENLNNKITGAWYYSKAGKKAAKFDCASEFTSSGYALVSNGKQLFFVNKKFENVSTTLSFNSSKGWSYVIGADGIMTYSSGNNGYFVVYA